MPVPRASSSAAARSTPSTTSIRLPEEGTTWRVNPWPQGPSCLIPNAFRCRVLRHPNGRRQSYAPRRRGLRRRSCARPRRSFARHVRRQTGGILRPNAGASRSRQRSYLTIPARSSLEDKAVPEHDSSVEARGSSASALRSAESERQNRFPAGRKTPRRSVDNPRRSRTRAARLHIAVGFDKSKAPARTPASRRRETAAVLPLTSA